MMSILTTKMKMDAGKVKLFFQLNEGAGTVFTDIAGGVTITEASATHATAYAVDGVLLAEGAPTSGTIPDLTGKNLIFCTVSKPLNSAFLEIIVGDSTSPAGFSVGMTGSGVKIYSDAGATKTAGVTASSGQINLVAGTFNKTTGTLTSYLNIAGAGTAKILSTDASLHLTGSATPNSIKLNATAAGLEYGFFVIESDSLPSEANMLTYLDQVYTNFTTGEKVIPDGLMGL